MSRNWGWVAIVLLTACSGGTSGEQHEALEASLSSDDGGNLDDDTAACRAAGCDELVGGDAVRAVPAAGIVGAELGDFALRGDDAEDVRLLSELLESCYVALSEVDA